MSSEATAGQLPDIYGQLHPVETLELIERKQKEFLQELEHLPADKKKNALLANERCPSLVTDEFRLMFLRCEVFNADLAAKRYAKYWDKRVEVFGMERAFQPLKIENMEEEMVAITIGFMNMIERNNDRTFLFVDPSKQDTSKYSRESMLRGIWYMLHASLEDSEDMQKRGVIILAYPNRAKLSQFDKGFMKEFFACIRGILPIRLSCIHICHPPSFFKIVWTFLKLLMSRKIRERVQVHSGSQEHVVEKLVSKFDFKMEDIPVDLGGTRKVDPNGWVEKKRIAGK